MGLLVTLIFLSPTSAAELNTTCRALAGAANCNIFCGKWVYDASYPLYDFSSCLFIDDQFNCLKYRRPDRNYLKYRWQPFSCNLATFNDLNFLERMRGKKIMFVDDSLSLNMWESLSREFIVNHFNCYMNSIPMMISEDENMEIITRLDTMIRVK
ncbi:hypothetical protein SASPL_148596 [Salvia splendens]|uniref:Trichome birefringence-like N-terminal domain-containing protein n=1 Tax=Salvia splendens TaxID=180675 RepID=A0A8X8Z3V2_SALSN|nr:hypothetical protein SASPL_148596 [Salvia splendens]